MDRISDYITNNKLNAEELKILVVDDEEGMCLLLADILDDCGYKFKYYLNAEEACQQIQRERFQIVITDIKMPGMDGMQFLKRILQLDQTISVIMITAYGSIGNAVECMELGAFNYITKPFNSKEIVAVIKKAIERMNLINENIQLKRELNNYSRTTAIIGNSVKIKETLRFAQKIAQTNFKVLVTGENGTGKELMARYIHECSPRFNQPFIPVQCSLLPEALLESELFGHKKGSFTGATQDKKGLFEEADKGTIFLDEIGDINYNIQGKLLRFLQEKEIKRVGDVKTKTVDVRLIFATNKDLSRLVKENQFREDLYYRIKEVEIRVPALRERKEDIPLLTRHFIDGISKEMGTEVGIDEVVLNYLMLYDWPGNIRELKNCLTNAAAVSEAAQITARDISRILLFTSPSYPEDSLDNFREMRKKILHDFDNKYITSCLIKNNGNITKTARELKIDKKNLWVMLKKYNIDFKLYSTPDKIK